MADEYLKYLLTLPPEEIVKWYQSKGYRFSWDWQDTWQEAHARAFTVAKAMKLDILQSIKDEVDKIFNEGITYEQFQKHLSPELRRLGWWGKVRADEVPGYDPDSGIEPDKIVQLGSPARLKTIYQTNANVSFNAARYKFQIENAASRPYWLYVQIERKHKRKVHARYAGKVFMWNDPIWNKIYPPNGFNCGCYVIALTKGEVEAQGLRVWKGSEVKVNVGKGWDYNPGKAYPAWDNQTDYKVSPGQKTYKNFNRPSVKDIPLEDRVIAPDKFPSVKQAGKDKLIELLKNEFGLTNRDWNLTDTADNDKALFTLDNSIHLLDKEDGRERYIPYIKAALQNPFEIYLTEYTDNIDPKFEELRKTYLGFFNDKDTKEDIYISVIMRGDSTIFRNAFEGEKGKIDKLRTGYLLYGK